MLVLFLLTHVHGDFFRCEFGLGCSNLFDLKLGTPETPQTGDVPPEKVLHLLLPGFGAL